MEKSKLTKREINKFIESLDIKVLEGPLRCNYRYPNGKECSNLAKRIIHELESDSIFQGVCLLHAAALLKKRGENYGIFPLNKELYSS